MCLLFIFADQVFIDPTFSGIFVCGPLQSFVVNVCTYIYTHHTDTRKIDNMLMYIIVLKHLQNKN